MNYVSTRGDKGKINPAQALLKGIADDKGLYVPENLDIKFNLSNLINKEYADLAEIILNENYLM